jgi:uncharacterized YccA/Bax inhibitor family protein
MAFRSGNPLLNPKRFTASETRGGVMTSEGAMNKSLLMIAIVMVVAAVTWWGTAAGIIPAAATLVSVIVGLIAGLVIAITLAFKPQWSPTLAPVYAIVEGVVLGAISMLFESIYPGIVMQAILLTFGIALAMLALFRSGFVKVNRTFVTGVIIATVGVVVVMLLVWILSLFGVTGPANANWGNGWFGIGFSLLVIIIATMNLLIDYAFIDEAAKHKYPKYFEWYGAFALTVTLVWLYIEILRLLIKLRSRD